MNHPASCAEPSTVKALGPAPRAAGGGFAVVVAMGRERGVRAVLEVGEPLRIFIGRAPECAIRLGDQLVSRRHAEVVWNGEALRIVDLGSANGTIVNGGRIRSVPLRGGETIAVGATLLHVVRVAPASTRASAGEG